MTETDFKRLNGERLVTLQVLIEESQRATELCDTWLNSGHIADYRAWQTQVRHIEQADRQYQDARQSIRDAGFLPPA